MTDRPNISVDSRFAANLKACLPDLTKSEARIARFLLLNEADLALETGASLAAKAGVSEITVSRFLRRIGYKGMAALKGDLKTARLADRMGEAPDDMAGDVAGLPDDIAAAITREAEAILSLTAQLKRPEWRRAIDLIWDRDVVYVTGFQTIRGLAEDFARRLAITRNSVRFLSPHDSGLSEWVTHQGQRPRSRLLILIDVVPYAREAAPIAALCRKLGFELIVITDEFNSWAYEQTPLVFHGATKVGTFLESTGPMATLLNLIVHAVAGKDPDRTRERIDAWPRLLKDLNLY